MQLVTGATGIVGSRLLLDLMANGKPIMAIKGMSGNMNLVERYFEDQPDKFNDIIWLEGDIRDPSFVHDAIQDCDQVYHCAARVSFNPSDRNQMYEINVRGTANIVNSCLEHAISKLCYVSSVAAVGRNVSNGFISEDSIWTTSKYNTRYAISKYEAELEVWRAVNEGLSVVIVNPTVILGRGLWDSGSAAIFKRIWDGIPFCPPGANGFVDVRDVTRAMIMLMESGIENERFVLCSENMNYRDLIEKIAESYNKKVNLRPAGSLLMEMAWRASWLISAVTGNSPMVTRETIRTASNSFSYSSQKIKDLLDFEFIPVSDSVRYNARQFLSDNNLLSKVGLSFA